MLIHYNSSVYKNCSTCMYARQLQCPLALFNRGGGQQFPQSTCIILQRYFVLIKNRAIMYVSTLFLVDCSLHFWSPMIKNTKWDVRILQTLKCLHLKKCLILYEKEHINKHSFTSLITEAYQILLLAVLGNSFYSFTQINKHVWYSTNYRFSYNYTKKCFSAIYSQICIVRHQWHVTTSI